MTKVGLSEMNFEIFAAKHYYNIFYDDIEFNEDIKRFIYLKRLFNQYVKNNELKHHLIMNHLVVIFNMWPEGAVPMLFVKLEGYESLLKTFLTFMERMPNQIDIIQDKVIKNEEIALDEVIYEVLVREWRKTL